MNATLYKAMGGCRVSLQDIGNACDDACSTLAGAILILRTFAEHGDEDTMDLCNAIKALLLHVDARIDNIRPNL